jgi:hypothetical protein
LKLSLAGKRASKISWQLGNFRAEWWSDEVGILIAQQQTRKLKNNFLLSSTNSSTLTFDF